METGPDAVVWVFGMIKPDATVMVRSPPGPETQPAISNWCKH